MQRCAQQLQYKLTTEHTVQTIKNRTYTHIVRSRKAPEADRKTINQTWSIWCTAEHIKAAQMNSVDVLRQPSEALTIALSFQHTTHEQLQRPCWKLTTCHHTLNTYTISHSVWRQLFALHTTLCLQNDPFLTLLITASVTQFQNDYSRDSHVTVCKWAESIIADF